MKILIVLHAVAWAEAYLHTKWHLTPSSRLATMDTGKNWGGSAPLEEGELCPHLTQCSLGWGRPPYQVVSWYIQPFGHNRHGPKIQGGVWAVPLVGWTWVPIWHNVAWAKVYLCTTSGNLIHPAVWPQ